MTGEIIDLDAIVGELEAKTVKVNGKSYSANPDPAVGVLYDLYKLGTAADAAGEDADPSSLMDGVQEILAEIFGETAGAEIFQTCGLQRVMALLAALMEAYSREGKAPGSSRASRRAGARSKPISNGSTGSTSAKRASGRNGSAARGSRN